MLVMMQGAEELRYGTCELGSGTASGDWQCWGRTGRDCMEASKERVLENSGGVNCGHGHAQRNIPGGLFGTSCGGQCSLDCSYADPPFHLPSGSEPAPPIGSANDTLITLSDPVQGASGTACFQETLAASEHGCRET